MTRIKNLILENQSIFLFMTVGGLTAALYIGLFGLFWHVCQWHYQIAISLAYTIAVVFYFLANRKFTFKSTGNTAKQLPKFLTLLLLNYVVTLIVMHITVEFAHLPPYFGIFAAIGTTFILSYRISKFWVFKNA